MYPHTQPPMNHLDVPDAGVISVDISLTADVFPQIE